MSDELYLREVISVKGTEQGIAASGEVSLPLLLELNHTIGDLYSMIVDLSSKTGSSFALIVALHGEGVPTENITMLGLDLRQTETHISAVEPDEPIDLPLENQTAELSVPKTFTLEKFYNRLLALGREHQSAFICLTILANQANDLPAAA